jgi:hypothetical protein
VDIFKIRIVNGVMLTMFVNGWGFLVQIYFVPSFYQLVYGYSAVKSGALLLPITLTQSRWPTFLLFTANGFAALFSTLSGLYIHRFGRYRECLLLGWAVWAVGLGLFSTLNGPSLGKQIGFALLSGFGLGNTLQPSLIAVQASVERKHMAIVTSFRNFIRNLGGTLGLAISGTIINNAIRASLTSHGVSKAAIQQLINSPDLFRHEFGTERTDLLRAELAVAYVKGFRVIFNVCAVLNALAFVAAWFLIPQVELIRDDDAKLKEEGKRRHAKEPEGGVEA